MQDRLGGAGFVAPIFLLLLLFGDGLANDDSINKAAAATPDASSTSKHRTSATLPAAAAPPPAINENSSRTLLPAAASRQQRHASKPTARTPLAQHAVVIRSRSGSPTPAPADVKHSNSGNQTAPSKPPSYVTFTQSDEQWAAHFGGAAKLVAATLSLCVPGGWVTRFMLLH